MKIKEYILGGHKSFGISHPKLLWQVILLVPMQTTRFLFCFMVALFNTDYRIFFECWKNTQ